VEDGKIVGLLRRKQLIQALSAHDRDTPVREVAADDFFTTEPGAPLDELFQRMNAESCTTVPVVEEDRLVWLLTLENVGELIMISSALRGRAPAAIRRSDVNDDAVRKVAGDDHSSPSESTAIP
jgi:predicted transcriptional regulator